MRDSYYLINEYDTMKASGAESLSDIKSVLFHLEDIRIMPREDDGWKVVQYNKHCYVDNSPKVLYNYSNEWKNDKEVFSSIDVKELAKKLGYTILKSIMYE